jgi:hypothetical protein
MAGFTGVRGGGLAKAQKALVELGRDSGDLIARERESDLLTLPNHIPVRRLDLRAPILPTTNNESAKKILPTPLGFLASSHQLHPPSNGSFSAIVVQTE